MGQLVVRIAQPGGPVAETIQGLWWLMLALGVAVFVLFMVLLGRGLFRSERHADEPDGRRLTRRWIVLGGVLMPVGVLAVVFGGTVQAMRAMPSSGSRGALIVDIVGHQWWFEVRYPDHGVSSRDEMHIPVGRQVELRLTSADVIHSFWVPQLGGKMDMLPDKTNTLVLQADRPGEYISRCSEFCGLHHAHMKLLVVADPADRFDAWLAARR